MRELSEKELGYKFKTWYRGLLVRVDVWRRLHESARPSLKDLLLSDEGKIDEFGLPARGQSRSRATPARD